MTKRKSFLMVFIMVLVLPIIFMLSSCFEENNNNSNNINDTNDDTPLLEGHYRITVSNTTGGSVNVSKRQAQEGEEITLSYSANNGYLFVSITVKDSQNNNIELNNNKFIMPKSNVTITATFVENSGQSYYFEIIPNMNGSIEILSPSEEEIVKNQGKIPAGTKVYLGCNIDRNGYELKSWDVVDGNGNKIIVNSDNSFIMPNSNVSISANVGEATCKVSVDTETAKILDVTIKDENNNIILDGGEVKAYERIYISYDFKVEGYEVTGLKDQNGERIDTSPLVLSDLVISATFNPLQYGVKISNNWYYDGDYNASGVKSLYLTNKDGNRIDELINQKDRNRARTGEEVTINCEVTNKNYAIDYYILKYEKDGSLFEEHITENKFNMKPTSVNVSVKIKMVENTYNITYVLGGGKIAPYAPKTFKSTDDSLPIPNPTRDGYIFECWEEQEENSYGCTFLDGAISFYPKDFTDDLTLTARWIKAAKITYDYTAYTGDNLDGYNGKYVDDNNPSYYKVGDYVYLNNPIYAYGDFNGWYTSPTFEEESKIEVLYAENEDELNDITLYAKMGLKNFHINFVKIGVSSNGTKILADSTYLDWFNLSEEPRDLTRDLYNEKTYTLGYTFEGFYTDKDLTIPVTEVSNELDKSVTIYAKETLDTYTITYYYRGEVITPPNWVYSYTIETGKIFMPTYDNFTNAYGTWIFRGWRLNNYDTGEIIYSFEYINPSENPEKFHGNIIFYGYYELQ